MDSLPNEIIIRILRCLDQQNLQSASLTCKHWKDLIESSCRWSLTIRYHNQIGFDGQWIDFMLLTNRKFGTIKLDKILPIETLQMFAVFRRHGVNVVNLRLIKSQIDSLSQFAELLKYMPNLKHVTIFNTKCNVIDVPPEQVLPELKSLKTLEIEASDCSIVECFRTAKITTMKAVRFHDEYSLRGEYLEHFLQSQEMVTTLAFDSTVLHMTRTMIGTVPFQLTRLCLLDIQSEDTQNHHSRLLTFMISQASTLIELKLETDGDVDGRWGVDIDFGIPSVLLECIFANMSQLKTLSLEINGIPKTNEVYERLEENRSITNLTLLGREINNKKTLRFFSKLPNIHSVTVPGWCDRHTFWVMGQSWNELQLLDTDIVYANSFDRIKFASLKKLRIRRLNAKINWNKFTKAHSRLTELTIEDVQNESCFNSDDIEQIATNITLQSLKLGGKFSPDRRFFEVIWEKCPDLRVLDLENSCISEALKNDISCNLLRFCGTIK